MDNNNSNHKNNNSNTNSNDSANQMYQNRGLISFFSRRGPDLLSKFHGETEANLRALFKCAQQCAPSVIFFDEIDGLCPIRSFKHEQVHNSVVTTLLSLMDGLDTNATQSRKQRVFVIAATNRIDNLDPALRRPGRFDREIFVGLPNVIERVQILNIHSKHWKWDQQWLMQYYQDNNANKVKSNEQKRNGNKSLTWDTNDKENENEGKIIVDRYFQELSEKKLMGFSGADIKSLCNEAFLAAINRICPELKDTSNLANGTQKMQRNEETAAKLQNIRMIFDDIETVLNDGFKPSVQRHNFNSWNFLNTEISNENDSSGINDGIKQVLERAIEKIECFIDYNNSMKEDDIDDDIDAMFNEMDDGKNIDENDIDTVSSEKEDRMESENANEISNKAEYVKSSKLRRMLLRQTKLLIDCKPEYRGKVKEIIGVLLHKLDLANIEYLTFPDIMSQPSLYEAYCHALSLIKQCAMKNNKISVIVIPNIEVWLNNCPRFLELSFVFVNVVNAICYIYFVILNS